MDTIANTISLPTPQTGTATMFDLKADDFATTSGGSQTLLVAAGQLPFVVADPQLSGSSAVLYPQSSAGIFNTNPVQPLLLTSPDGTTNSLLCYGSRVAVGTIPVTDASGNTVSKHIAVVTGLGGNGPSASTTSCPAPAGGAVLMVVDLSQAYSQGSPFAPKPVGFLQLPTSATDVILNGTVALVATGTNVLLINLQNPAQPTLAGQINGTFGNGIALSADGFLVGSVNNGSGKAVQTATFEPVVATQCPSPLLASLVSGTPTQNPVYKTVQSVTCTIRVVPSSTPAASATISWKQVDQTVLLGMSNVPLAGGIGSVLLPAGIKVAGSAALAQSTSVNTENNQPIKGLAQTVTLGTVNLVMDFNNDSVVDDATDLPLKSSKSVAFWASDAAGKFLQISDLADRENLLDYVTVRLEVAAPTAQYQIGLRVVGTGAGVGRWFIADKVGTGLDYLQISGTSKQQQSVVSSGCSTSTNQPNMLGGECTPITDMVSFPQMTVGTHEYLFRCDLCSSGNRTLQIVTKIRSGTLRYWIKRIWTFDSFRNG